MIKRKVTTKKKILIGLCIVPALFVGSAAVVGTYEGITGKEIVKIEEVKEEPKAEAPKAEAPKEKPVSIPKAQEPVVKEEVKTEAEQKAEDMIQNLTPQQRAVFFTYREEIINSNLDDFYKQIAVLLMYEGVSQDVTERKALDYYVGSRLMDAIKKAKN